MDFWPRVDELIERAPTVADLHAHRLHLYAAWRWRSLGRPLASELVELERGAAVVRLAAPALLRRIREAYDGPMILLKGAEAGARYPQPGLRPTTDLDLLVPDADAVQRMLVAGGFTELEGLEPEDGHHLPQLEWPGLLMAVEIHSRPNWPRWLSPPPTEQLFAAATTESVVGHGVLALPPAHHALVLAAHAWTDAPIARLGQLVDYLLMSHEADATELEALARRWNIERLWRTTDAIARRVLLGHSDRVAGSALWTRRLESMRDRTVLGSKLAALVAPFWGLPPGTALVATARGVADDLRPAKGETWAEKVSRTAGGLRQGFGPRSVRVRALAAEKRRSLGH